MQPSGPRSWRHRCDAHASRVRSEDDALGVPRGQPSPVPHLARALVAQLYLCRLGGQPQQSTGAGTSFTASTPAGICTSLKMQPCNLAINFATSQSVWLAGQKSLLVGAETMLFRTHKINTQRNQGRPSMPAPQTAAGAGQRCRAELPSLLPSNPRRTSFAAH